MTLKESVRTAGSVFFSKRNMSIISVIVAVAVSLATLVYFYYSFSSIEINKIASQDVRSNSRIESYDFARILENEIDTISTSLGIIANAPAVKNNQQIDARTFFDSAKNNSESWVDFFAWLGPDGKLIWSSNLNETVYQEYKGTDLSFRPYFTVPKRTLEPYYSSVIASVDNVSRIFVSVPILGSIGNQSRGGVNNNTSTLPNAATAESDTPRQIFNGIVYSGIRLDTVGDLLKDQLIPEFQSSVTILDRDGTILYSPNDTYIGQNVFSNEIQSAIYPSLIPLEFKDKFNDTLKASLAGKQGSEDIEIGGQLNTVSYQPVTVETNQASSNNNTKYFMSVFIASPHLLTNSVSALIDQQKNFSIIMISVISALFLGIAFLVITWNKRLRNTVNTKTIELKDANEQLKAHGKMQKEFINIAAHELRTPTQAVLGYSEILKIQSKKENRKDEAIDAIYRNATRLQHLANDILDVTRIESQTLKLNKQRFNLNEVLSYVVSDFKNEIRKNNSPVNIYYEAAQELTIGPFIEADRERVTQVISNLISNAIKFTQRGTISVSAKVLRGCRVIGTKETAPGISQELEIIHRSYPPDQKAKEIQVNADAFHYLEAVLNNETEIVGNQVLVSVKDTGSGIDPEIVSKLFSKFTTKSLKGTGLGLFICKSIVEAHGGRIWAENNDGADRIVNGEGNASKGATFFFTLPIDKD
ncbi:MAG: sensor histidine kinase [Nitrososphaeraceae archaeon]